MALGVCAVLGDSFPRFAVTEVNEVMRPPLPRGSARFSKITNHVAGSPNPNTTGKTRVPALAAATPSTAFANSVATA